MTLEDKRNRWTRQFQSQDDEDAGRSGVMLPRSRYYTKSVRRYPVGPLHMRFASPSKRGAPALCLGVFLRRTYSTVQGGMPIIAPMLRERPSAPRAEWNLCDVGPAVRSDRYRIGLG